MKKIVGVILAAGLLTGIATAADIGFSYKGSNYFTSNSENLNYEGGLRKDCLSVSLTTEAAGIVIDYDTANGKLVHDEYYGWLNFGLPVGSLQVTAGVWKGRYVNRIRADQGDLDSQDFELFKPGVINGKTGEDSDNLTGGNLGLVAAWTLADKLPGALIVKLGLFKNSTWNPESNDTGNEEDLKVTAGFTGEVAYRQDGLFNVNFAMRSLTKSNWAFGLWFSPLMAEKLQLTVGGTVATVNSYKKDDSWGDNKTEWGVDLRARYQVTDSFSLTTMNNISSGTNTGITNDDKNELVLWDMLNATYAFADNLKAALTLQSLRGGLDDDHESKWDVIVSPSLAIQATERAAVTTSVRAELANIHNWAITNVKLTIPVIFSYNY